MNYYPAFIEQASDGGYGVTFPDLPGCTSGGADFEQALANAANALKAHLVWMAEDGDEIPLPSALDAPPPEWLGDIAATRVLIPVGGSRQKREFYVSGSANEVARFVTGLRRLIDAKGQWHDEGRRSKRIRKPDRPRVEV